jgi:hypothetical protein
MGLEILGANFVDRLEMVNVADIDPAYVIHRTAPGFDRGLQVLAHLAGLCCDVADLRIVPSAGHRCIRVDGPVRNEQRPRAGIEETKPESASSPAASPAPAVLQAEKATQSALSFN